MISLVLSAIERQADEENDSDEDSFKENKDSWQSKGHKNCKF